MAATSRWPAGSTDWVAHMERHPKFWIKLGNLESRLLRDELDKIRITAPIFIAGLARSGSTFLLEALTGHKDTVTHRYKDFPPVFTPYWWNRFLGFMPKKDAAPAERAHKDGIKITEDSPEAFEEALWMAFHPKLHDPGTSAMLDRDHADAAFEGFYKDHIKKLLAVRQGKRYLSKGNYNLTRLAYLQSMFDECPFPPADQSACLAHRLTDQAAPSLQRWPCRQSKGARSHAPGRPFRIRPGPPPHQCRRRSSDRGDNRALGARRGSRGGRPVTGPICTARSRISWKRTQD